jgi:flavin-dependent dehydrogenase
VLCVALGRGRFRAFGGTWPSLLDGLISGSPKLGEMLAGAKPLLPRPLAVAGIPYGFLHRQRPRAGPDLCDNRLFRLGDQGAVIPSLTGDGIAIALHSGSLAAKAWQEGDDSAVYHRRLERDVGGQMRLAGLLHRAAMVGPLQPVTIRGAGWFPGLLKQAARGTRLKVT